MTTSHQTYILALSMICFRTHRNSQVCDKVVCVGVCVCECVYLHAY